MTEGMMLGLQRVTLADFPGEVAATIFTTGCNLRCPYCHNADLAVGIVPTAFLSHHEIFEYLKKRRHLLGGVCITGGEPLMQKGIKELIQEIQKLGFKIKLDTNGLFPEKLKTLKVDFIAMDVKTSFNRYGELGITSKGTELKLKESVKWIIDSKIPHEFRTTAMPGLVNRQDVSHIAKEIEGADRYVLAGFNPQNTLDPKASEIKPWSQAEMEELASIARATGLSVFLRGV